MDQEKEKRPLLKLLSPPVHDPRKTGKYSEKDLRRKWKKDTTWLLIVEFRHDFKGE